MSTDLLIYYSVSTKLMKESIVQTGMLATNMLLHTIVVHLISFINVIKT